jgi:ubiquinone/menaquinone biosynthesis C-methylase UbiE
MTEDKVNKVREQFDNIPYPNIAIELTPKDDINTLFKFSLTTCQYKRSQKIVSPKGKIILDLGCGTGWLTLGLALANPEARIIGIDISSESIKFAKNRLAYHSFPNTEFYAMPFEDITSLNLTFDFIHCSDVLYLLPEPLEAMKVMRSVLSEQGIIQANLHSIHQRYYFYQGQKLCKYLGLMDDAPTELEFSLIRDLMNSIDERVLLKTKSWNSDPTDSFLAANHLLQEDKGYTIPEMFQMIADADLEFISMINWNQWNIRDLYIDKNKPSEYLDMIIDAASVEEKLHIYDLLQPVNRLLDFWCCHLGQVQPIIALSDWEDADWQNAKAYLHPQLKHPKIREALDQAIAYYAPFNIHVFLNINAAHPISLYTASCACLHLLWEQPLSVIDLAKAWQKIKPRNWLTQVEISEADALSEIKDTLIEMEFLALVLVQKLD